MVTSVVGSCTSDGEDYFALRVDLVDSASKTVLSSNSTPIGYNANNFAVNVENVATTPMENESWFVEVDTYLIQAGATTGKYLLNATLITIQIGSGPLPEFHLSPVFILLPTLTALALTLTRKKLPKRKRG